MVLKRTLFKFTRIVSFEIPDEGLYKLAILAGSRKTLNKIRPGYDKIRSACVYLDELVDLKSRITRIK